MKGHFSLTSVHRVWLNQLLGGIGKQVGSGVIKHLGTQYAKGSVIVDRFLPNDFEESNRSKMRKKNSSVAKI